MGLWVYGLPLSFCRTWSGSIYNVHIALQEIQKSVLMLCRMAFSSGNVVALHLDSSAAKAYLCNKESTMSLFLSRLACCILNLTNKHSITLIPAYMHTHLNVQASHLSQERLALEWHFFLAYLEWHLCFWVIQSQICWHSHVPINGSITIPWRISYLQELWGWTLSTVLSNIRWIIYFLLLHEFFWCCPNFWYERSHVSSDFLFLITPFWMEVSWLPTDLNML